MNKGMTKQSQLLAAAFAMLLLAATAVLVRAQTPAKPEPAAKPRMVEGTYDSEVIAEGVGNLPFTLVVKKEGEKLVTEVKDGGDLNITGITVNGEDVTLAATHQDRPFELAGKFNETGMGGKWEAGGYSGTWSAKRRADK